MWFIPSTVDSNQRYLHRPYPSTSAVYKLMKNEAILNKNLRAARVSFISLLLVQRCLAMMTDMAQQGCMLVICHPARVHAILKTFSADMGGCWVLPNQEVYGERVPLVDLVAILAKVRDVDIKHDYAFVEFSDPRNADDARYSLNGRDFDGSRIVVEFAKGGPRGSGGGGGSREYIGRGPPPGSGRCFNCGIDGHWARDCKAGDWKNKCYRCGERDHIERNCHNSPKSVKRGRSYSRSPSPRTRRGRSRSQSYSRSRSDSRSRSPAPRRRERSLDRADRRSRSPHPSNGRKLSRSPDNRGRSPQERSASPVKDRKESKRNVSDYSGSPKRNESKSPASGEREANGRSPSPRDSKGSESPCD